MGDEPGSVNRTQLLVAVIGLVSAVSVAAIANADKLFRRHAEPAPSAAAAPKAVSSGEPAPAAASRPSGEAVRAVAGRWRDDEGYNYVFTQEGASYRYRMSRDGADLSGGSGRIIGGRLHHTFDSPDGAGTCDADLSAAGDVIAGTCTRGGQSWPFAIRRA